MHSDAKHAWTARRVSWVTERVPLVVPSSGEELVPHAPVASVIAARVRATFFVLKRVG